jgi:hypothetical protein
MTPARHLPDDAFPYLSLAERDRLLAHGREQRFEPGEVILRERHRSRAIYVLISGRLARRSPPASTDPWPRSWPAASGSQPRTA